MPVNKEKLEKSKQRAERREKLTNWFMINMVWAFAGIIILKFVENGYNYSRTLMHMNTVLIVIAIIMLLGSAALFVCHYLKKGKNLSRMWNYGIFTAVIGVVSLIMAFYAQIRLLLMNFIPALNGVNSGWRVWFFMVLIGIYLIVAFVWYLIQYNKKA